MHRPTKEMWVDVLTKPLQGRAFKDMHAKLMNCKVIYKEEQARKGDKQQANAKVGIRKGTATGRVTKHGPTQPLQEGVGRSTAKRPRGMVVRCPVGVSRLQTKLTNQEKTTGPMKSQ